MPSRLPPRAALQAYASIVESTGSLAAWGTIEVLALLELQFCLHKVRGRCSAGAVRGRRGGDWLASHGGGAVCLEPCLPLAQGSLTPRAPAPCPALSLSRSC